MSASNIFFTLDGRGYWWGGYYGSVLISRERGLKPGDTRVISDQLFYVECVESRGLFKPEVSWTILKISSEGIGNFKKSLFGL